MISFPSGMYQVLEERSNRRGMLVPEYVRFIVLNEINDDFEKVPLVDIETEKVIAESLDDYDNGDYITANTREEIAEILELN